MDNKFLPTLQAKVKKDIAEATEGGLSLGGGGGGGRERGLLLTPLQSFNISDIPLPTSTMNPHYEVCMIACSKLVDRV